MNSQEKSAKSSSSREIFLKYFKLDEDGKLDASDVFGIDCYNEWCRSRKRPPMSMARAFQCAIRNVVTGANGAKSFGREEEAAVLDFLRKKRNTAWPCLTDGTKHGNFGWKHIRGWHEQQEAAEVVTSPVSELLNQGRDMLYPTLPMSMLPIGNDMNMYQLPFVPPIKLEPSGEIAPVPIDLPSISQSTPSLETIRANIEEIFPASSYLVPEQ